MATAPWVLETLRLVRASADAAENEIAPTTPSTVASFQVELIIVPPDESCDIEPENRLRRPRPRWLRRSTATRPALN
jgi:hypothetical protein